MGPAVEAKAKELRAGVKYPVTAAAGFLVKPGTRNKWIRPSRAHPKMHSSGTIFQLEELEQQKCRFEEEALDIFQLVVAEWSSDPMSVQCFDLRIVNRAQYLVALLKDVEPKIEKLKNRVGWL